MIKKNMFRLMVALIATTLCFGFASCGSNDDDDKISSPIVGTWENSANSYEKFIFSSNGSCTRQYVVPETKGITDPVIDDEIPEQYYYGMYSVDGNNLNVRWTKQRIRRIVNGESKWEEDEYSPARVETGSFTITGDAIVINLGDGSSFITWRGKKSK